MTELKECPCCGGNPVEYRTTHTSGHGEADSVIGIRCDRCGLGVSEGDYSGYREPERTESVTIKWNRRP